MQIIVAPINPGDEGTAVANLQTGLITLLRNERNELIQVEPVRRAELLSGLSVELNGLTYRDATKDSVAHFQEQRHLRANGKVDEETAKALNTVLREIGALTETPATETGRPEVSLGMSGDRVGEVQKGLVRLGYEIPALEAAESTFGPGTQTAIRRFQDAMGLTVSGRADERTLEALARALAEQGGALWRVEGRLFHEHGGPAAGVSLCLRQALLFGETRLLNTEAATTDALGYYSATYAPEGDKVMLTVLALIGPEEVTLSEPVPAQRRELLNLVLPAKFQPPAESEFFRLNEAVKTHLDGRRLGEAREDGERNDLALLHQLTSWDARILALAAQADRLASLPAVTAAGLGGEALYGLVRAGLPTTAERLAMESEATVVEALKKTTEAGIVRLGDEDIRREKDAFRLFADQSRLTLRAPGALSTTGEMLKSAGLEEAAQTGFTRAYARHLRSGNDLWTEAKNEGVADEQIARLRVQGKLAYLTQNHLPVIEKLMATVTSLAPDDISDLIDHDYHEAGTWQALYAEMAGGSDEEHLATVRPPAYETTTAREAVDLASADHARHLRIAYPTHVARRVMEQDTTNRLNLRIEGQAMQVHQVLRRAQSLPGGFELGRQSVDAFVKRNRAALFPGAAEAEITTATKALRTVQRVYQISPSVDTMTNLMSLGFKSAHDVTRFSKADFLRAYAHRFAGSEEAALIYDKATQVSVVTFNFFSMAQQAKNGLATGATHQQLNNAEGSEAAEDTAERNSVLKNLVTQFPTLETLLGEQDYAECQGCQSVLSPSAYFVDLLEFLNPDDLVWNNFLAEWKHSHLDVPYPNPKPFDALMLRRPDLEHLPLTCENTETVLPYIDVVNEILEYSVANGLLKPEAVHDTADARSDELIAEPQNLLPTAYEKLKAARYPLTLPFDLWLETVRRFFKHQDTTLAGAMAALCQTEKLHDDAVPAAPYDLADVAIESLGVSQSEAKVLTDPVVLTEWFTLYGYETAATAEAALRTMSVPNAKLLSRKLGVSYKELTALVQTEFLNPALKPAAFLHRLGLDFGDLRRLDRTPLNDQDAEAKKLENEAWENRIKTAAETLKLDPAVVQADVAQARAALDLGRILVLSDSDTSASFDHTILRFADVAGTPISVIALLKLNLFVRLWRKLGWSMDDTDRALCLFVGDPATLNDFAPLGEAMHTALLYFARTQKLLAALSLGAKGLPKLLTFWTELPTRGKQSLYARLFLNRGVLRNAPGFDHPLGAYLSDSNMLLNPHMTAVQGALGLSADDIARLVADAPAALHADQLTLPVVSWLYRHATLAKALKLTVAEVIALKAISGLNPFALLKTGNDVVTVADDQMASQTLPFIELAAMLRERGLKVAELDALLRHRYAVDSKDQPRPEAGLALAQTLAAGQHQIAAEHALPETVDAAWLLPRLSLLLPADLVAEIIALCFDTAEFEVSTEDNVVEPANQIPAAAFNNEPALRFGYSAVRKRQRLAWRGYLTKAKADALKATPLSASNTALVTTLIDKLRQQQGPAFAATLKRALSLLQARTDFVVSPGMATTIATATIDAMLAQVEFRAQQPVALSADVAKAIEALGNHPQVRLYHDVPTQTLHVTCIGVLSDAARQDLLKAPAAAVTALLVEVQKQAADVIKGLRTLLSDLFASNPPLVLADTARRAFAEAWRPLIVARAVRQFIETTLTTELAGDSALTNLLLNDAAGLHLATDPDKTLCDIFMEAGTPPKTLELDGYFQVPTSGAYRLTLGGLAKNDRGGIVVNGHTVFDKNVGDADHNQSEAVELRAGAFVSCQVVDVADADPTKVKVLIQGETLPQGGLERLPIYSVVTVNHIGDARLALATALRFVQTSGISEAELRFAWEQPADFAGLSLSTLPLTQSAAADSDAAGLLKQWQALARLAQLKTSLGIEAATVLAILRAPSIAEVSPWITPLLSGDATKIGEVAGHLHLSAPLNAASLERLWQALRMVARLGGSDESALDGNVADVLKWVGPAPSQATARDVRNAAKARADLDAWPQIAQPIYDPLRQLQRDALVAFLLHREQLERVEQLYEVFLLDPATEPVVQISRMSLAIGCVQLFIHRCFLNLEIKVHPRTLDAELWKWMQSIALWGAGRRIYIQPENYLQPEFRDDKTHLFQELEGKLLQGNLTSDLAEEAFHGYLQGLQEIAKMQMVTMYCEQHPDPAKNVVHLIGRVPNAAPKYFYRRCSNSMWTPWEPISVSIEGDHVTAIVWRGRLHVFWLTFLPAGDQSEDAKGRTPEDMRTMKSSALIQRKEKVQLNWSEYYQGKWSARKFGQGEGATLEFDVSETFKQSNIFIHASKGSDDKGGDGPVRINLQVEDVTSSSAKGAAKVLGGPSGFSSPGGGVIGQLSGKTMTVALNYGFKMISKLVPPITQPAGPSVLPTSPLVTSVGAHPTKLTALPGRTLLEVDFSGTIKTTAVMQETEGLTRHKIIDPKSAFQLLTCSHPAPLPNAEIAALTAPFFYEDAEAVFFVEPTFVEKTVNEWQGYGVPLFPPSKFPDKARVIQPDLSAHFKEQLVIPERLLDPVGPVAKKAVTPLSDWVTQPAASIQFNGQRVGPGGGLFSAPANFGIQR